MTKQIPSFLIEKLEKQYGSKPTMQILEGYSKKRKVTIRANTIKTSTKQIEQELIKAHISYQKVLWYEDAFILENITEKEVKLLSIYETGQIYMQSLSSMLPAIILEPKPQENILDMAAAPR